MGYDDGECVECRLERNGGNVEEYARYNLCMGCLHEYAKDSAAMDGRLFHVLKDNMSYGAACDNCGCCNSIVFEVSACEHHYNQRLRMDDDENEDSYSDLNSEGPDSYS